MKYFILLIVLFQINTINSQISGKKINIDDSMVYSYNDDVSFQILRMKEHKNGRLGYVPLRGATSYFFWVAFENHSDKITFVDLERIELADLNKRTKSKVLWYDTSIQNGSRTKTRFRLKPSQVKKYALLFIINKYADLHFMFNDNLYKIKMK